MDIELYDFQVDVVDQALQLENTANVENICINMPFGSGKTIVVCAIIALCPVPKRKNYIIEHVDKHIYREIKDTVVYLPCNLVFCESTVLSQWQHIIYNYTKLSCLTIKNINTLQDFAAIVEDRQKLEKYNIILVNSTYIYKSNIGLMHYIAQLTSGMIWARIFYDDFDTANYNAVAYPSGNWNYIVSATQSFLNNYDYINLYRLEKKLTNIYNYPDNFIIKTKYISTKNMKNIITPEINIVIPKLYFKTIVCDQKGDNLIKMISTMPAKNAQRIVEMFNSESFNEAAAELNIICETPAALFHKLLSQEYDKYKKINKIMVALNKYRDKIEKVFKEMSAGNEEEFMAKNNNVVDLPIVDEVFESLRVGQVPNIVSINDDFLESLGKYDNEIRNEMYNKSMAARRTFDNIACGQCQVCREELKNITKGVFIMRCCNIILCPSCASTCNYGVKKCTGCKSNICTHDLLFVPANINIAELSEMDASSEDTTALYRKVEVSKKLIEFKKILLGEPVNYLTCFEVFDHSNLMNSNIDVPYSGGKRKILLFTGFAESLRKVTQVINDCGMNYEILQGSANNRTNLVNKFKNGEFDILIINEHNNCSGVNLEFVTDLIVMHKIIKTNIMDQLLGRIHRIGKKYNNTVHFIYNFNEL